MLKIFYKNFLEMLKCSFNLFEMVTETVLFVNFWVLKRGFCMSVLIGTKEKVYSNKDLKTEMIVGTGHSAYSM